MKKPRPKPNNDEPVKLTLKARTLNQQKLIEAIYGNDVIFCNGPAGTGKTIVSVGVGVELLQQGKVDKIVITRPMVCAGEDPGAIPGGVEQKISPFLAPIFDELKNFLTKTEISNLKKSGQLLICPLAYMRGRTFKNSFIMMDEAQNATFTQLKMVLSRIGTGSKVIVNGDITQCDLPSKHVGGLLRCLDKLKNIKGLEIIQFSEQDIVRHPLIKEIMEALEK